MDNHVVLYVGIQIKEVRTMKFTLNEFPFNPAKPTEVEVTMELNATQDMITIDIDGSQTVCIHSSGSVSLNAQGALVPLLMSLKCNR